jgi:arylsulfatase A-like enzyme
MNTKPNILFIISDQHNAKVLGHKGHPNVKTPHLDRLAGEGVRFENAITQNPICTPSRVSYLSGQYCHNHGYYGLSGPNPGGLPTVLGHFRRAGYRTGAIGKIHCPEYWVEDDCDHFRDAGGSSIGGNPEYNAYLSEKGVLQDADYGRFQEQRPGAQSWDGRVSRMKYEDSPEGWIASETIGFMAQTVAEGKPFFVQASFPRPHQIYAPSEPFWSMYDEGELVLPPNAEYDMALKSPHLRHMAESVKDGSWTVFEPRTFEAGRLRKLHGYLGCVTQVDHAIGQMLDWLAENGLQENTIVIYATDHGDYACEHGIMEKAPGICADAITRIPFIWRWTGQFSAGHTADEIVETVDLSTTLCSLAGLEPMQTSDGQDLSHLLRGERGEVHNIGVTEFAWSKSVRKGQYRYVHYPTEMFAQDYPEGFGELYDLQADPWEMKNLYFEPEYAALIQEMKGDLLDWLLTTTRPKTALGLDAVPGEQAVTRFGGVFYDTDSDQVITRYRCSVNQDGKFHPDRLRALCEMPLSIRNYL